jgi:hypothetical protein
MLSRVRPIAAPGMVLSQATSATMPSNRYERPISSIESAITSREISEPFMPLGAHGDAVADGDRVELHRRAARGADALLDLHGELPQVEVAGHGLDPGVGDADDRLAQVVVGEADPLSIARAAARLRPWVTRGCAC